MTIALCCDNEEECRNVKNKIVSFYSVSVRSFTKDGEFLSFITKRSDLIMMIVQRGSYSTETAMLAREQNPKGKLLWFCDLDFSLLSFRLKATYFGIVPIEEEKLKQALSYCEIDIKDSGKWRLSPN